MGAESLDMPCARATAAAPLRGVRVEGSVCLRDLCISVSRMWGKKCTLWGPLALWLCPCYPGPSFSRALAPSLVKRLAQGKSGEATGQRGSRASIRLICDRQAGGSRGLWAPQPQHCRTAEGRRLDQNDVMSGHDSRA